MFFFILKCRLMYGIEYLNNYSLINTGKSLRIIGLFVSNRNPIKLQLKMSIKKKNQLFFEDCEMYFSFQTYLFNIL